MAQINMPEQAPPPAKHYSVVGTRILLVMAILAVPVLIVGSVVSEMNSPAAQAQASTTGRKPAPAPISADEAGERRTIAPRRTQRSREATLADARARGEVASVRYNARYSDCLEVMRGLERDTPHVTIVNQPDARIVRFPEGEGSTILACSRLDNSMIVTTSPHR